MAAPVTDTIRNPDDRGNRGKLLQAQHELSGTTPIYAPHVIVRTRRALLGVYWFVTSTLAVAQTAHDGTSTGFFWLQNPVGSAIRARLRRLQVAYVAGSSKVDRLTLPRMRPYRFTFTGTASGATLSTAKRRTSDLTSTADVRTAVTGMTVTLGNPAWGTVVPVILFETAGQIWGGGPVVEYIRANDEDAYLDLAAGEGVVFAQANNAVASDNRRLIVSGCWDEYDAA